MKGFIPIHFRLQMYLIIWKHIFAISESIFHDFYDCKRLLEKIEFFKKFLKKLKIHFLDLIFWDNKNAQKVYPRCFETFENSC